MYLCKVCFTSMIKSDLRKIRRQTGMTQKDLAASIDVSRQTIHSIEVGKYIPSVEVALKLAKSLKLKVEDIFKLKWS